MTNYNTIKQRDTKIKEGEVLLFKDLFTAVAAKDCDFAELPESVFQKTVSDFHYYLEEHEVIKPRAPQIIELWCRDREEADLARYHSDYSDLPDWVIPQGQLVLIGRTHVFCVLKDIKYRNYDCLSAAEVRKLLIKEKAINSFSVTVIK